MRCDLIAVTIGSMTQAAMETVMDAGSGTGRYRHRLAVLIDADNVPSEVVDGLCGMRGRW
ncbi:hypothetical protein [Rhizobium nepotum]|uniref:hypothetical protein n=1 Tax=Rhizobium nepotum TaxID=1035271 RepID=UPI003CF5E0D5